MYDGKKNTSYEIFYKALNLVGTKLPGEEKSALEVWRKALDNVTPQLEVKSRRIGGATFQVPTEIRPERKESISMKNLILTLVSVAESQWLTNWLLKFWMHTMNKAVLSNVRKTCTVWLKLTVHSLTSDSNQVITNK